MGSYLPRHIDVALDRLLGELPAVLLTGPRGCGKTTTALRRTASVLRLDRPEQAGPFRAAPDDVLAAQRPPVLIDEWQVAPESMGAVKRAVDSARGSGRFLLTGSVRARLEPAWPATGRVVPISMYGLTVAEQLRTGRAERVIGELVGVDGPAVAELPTPISLVDYLALATRGGFPEVVGLSDFARTTWYRGYLEQLIRHDVSELAEVRAPVRLAALLRAVALNTAGQPTMTTLASAAQIDHRTAATYLDLLEDLRIIERVPAWASSRLNRLAKVPKYYILDPGLAAHLAGDTVDGALRNNDRLGRLIDTFVFAQIRPLLQLTQPVLTAHHLRDKNQEREIDLLLESASGELVGLEIKASRAVDARSGRHLAWLRDRIGSRFRRGIVLHTGTTTYPLGDRLWAMPIAALWQ